ncbi:hypothetical protein [Paenibacillus lautus]|uniref:hypothetical protein n=1 Tax=Paenibacillus lautus TaxID=1401 RepID=UPI003D2D7111
MTSPAVINGKFTPEFAAYTKLTLVNRLQNELNGSSQPQSSRSMTFEELMTALDNQRVINPGFARQTPSDEEEYNRIYQQQHGQNMITRHRYEAIMRAYQLGLVDLNGVLIM